MRALLAPLLAAALLTGCSDSTPEAKPTPSASPVGAYEALQPPTSPGVGSYDAVIANRVYAVVHGLLALQLLDQATLTGHNQQELVAQLQGTAKDPAVVAAVGAGPTARGLDYRPLFAGTATPATPPAEVVRSTYSADEVQGRGGEQGLRVTWSGSLRYAVMVGGARHEVAYALTIGYVFAGVSNEPGGVALVQVVRGSAHAAPVVPGCLAKGVLLPTTGAPTEADFGTGPYAPVPSACPV